MIWDFHNKRRGSKDGYAIYFEPIDGDLKKVRLVDETVDYGSSPIPRVDYFVSGRPVETSHLPLRVSLSYSDSARVKRENVNLPDYAVAHLANLVSDKFRALVEQLDPGVHQFVPVNIEWKNGEVDERPYFWFAPATRLYALDVEKTEPAMREMPDLPTFVRPDPSKPAHFFDGRGPSSTWVPVFRSDVVSGHDVFCAMDFPRKIFISDRLKQAFEDAGLTGWGVHGPYQLG